MAVRAIVLFSWIIIGMMCLPDAWFAGSCNVHECFRHTVCSETTKTFGHHQWFSAAAASVQFVVDGLFALGGRDYGTGNAVAYLGIVPAWGLCNAWLNRESKLWYAALIISVLIMFLVGQFGFTPDGLEGPKKMANPLPSSTIHKYPNWFWYCTEWCMRIADYTKLTYGGVCFVVFVVGIPGVLIGDSIWGILKRTERHTSDEVKM